MIVVHRASTRAECFGAGAVENRRRQQARERDARPSRHVLAHHRSDEPWHNQIWTRLGAGRETDDVEPGAVQAELRRAGPYGCPREHGQESLQDDLELLDAAMVEGYPEADGASRRQLLAT